MKWNKVRVYSFLLVAGLACAASQAAVLVDSSIPGGSNWYVHVNLELIRNTDAGQTLMMGFVDDALEDI